MKQTYARFRPDRVGRPQQMTIPKVAQDELGLLPGVHVRAEVENDVLSVSPDATGDYVVAGNLKNQRVVLGIQDIIKPLHAQNPLSAEPLRAEVEAGALRVWLREPLSLGEYRRVRYSHLRRDESPMAHNKALPPKPQKGGVMIGFRGEELAAHRAAADAANLSVPMYLRGLIRDGLKYRAAVGEEERAGQSQG